MTIYESETRILIIIFTFVVPVPISISTPYTYGHMGTIVYPLLVFLRRKQISHLILKIVLFSTSGTAVRTGNMVDGQLAYI